MGILVWVKYLVLGIESAGLQRLTEGGICWFV